MTLGWLEISIIILIIILLFGATRLPNAARSLGRSMRIFKSEMDEMKNDKHAAAGQQGPQQAIMPQQPNTQNFGQPSPGQAQPQGYAMPAGQAEQPQAYGQAPVGQPQQFNGQSPAGTPMPQSPQAQQATEATRDQQNPQPGA